MLCAYPHPNFWILHTDGSAKPNPGRMAIGAVLTGPHGEALQVSEALQGTGCNNEAELRAVQAGVSLALLRGARSLRIYTDSQWLLEQLAHDAQAVSTPKPTLRLAPRLEQVRSVLNALDSVQWRWVPRHHNTQADALARQALVALVEHESALARANDLVGEGR